MHMCTCTYRDNVLIVAAMAASCVCFMAIVIIGNTYIHISQNKKATTYQAILEKHNVLIYCIVMLPAWYITLQQSAIKQTTGLHLHLTLPPNTFTTPFEAL